MQSTGVVEASVESRFSRNWGGPGGAPAHPNWSLTRGGSGRTGPSWPPCEGSGRSVNTATAMAHEDNLKKSLLNLQLSTPDNFLTGEM